MKFSSRARYGLRMMVELARLLKNEPLVQLRRIAKITGLSNNYLGQLAISLRDNGLVVGISGKKGGYKLSRAPEEISLADVIQAVQGPIYATDCVINPGLCLNAEFCEARIIWSLVTRNMQQALEEYTLADVIDTEWKQQVINGYPDVEYLQVEGMLQKSERETAPGCPAEKRQAV